jgi:tetratricopeptide (TPR) repeat protein
MRRFVGLFCCVSIFYQLPLSGADLVQLRELYQRDRIFLLRDALEQPGSPESETLFYRAVIESRFGDESTAVDALRKFLSTQPDPYLGQKANEELASALAWLARYKDAADALTEALRLTPLEEVGREGTDNERAMFESLSDVAPQTVRFGPEVAVHARHNGLGSWNVPLQVNGIAGEWIFDTGANFSTVTESEAARMGLAVRDSVTYVKGSTEKKNPLRLAVARELVLGSVHVNNVVLLVLPDQALRVGVPKHEIQISGILGIPVIRFLGSVKVSAQGEVRIQGDHSRAPGDPNMFLDGFDPLVEARHSNQRLQMFLDTGANSTNAYPSLRESLSKDETAELKETQDRTGGAGGTVTREAEVLPILRLSILGATVGIKKATFSLEQPSGDKGRRDGVLGTDALASGFSLDFRAMRLQIE